MKRREFIRDASFFVAGAAVQGAPAKAPAAVSCPVTLLAMPDYGRDLSREIAAVMTEDGLRLKGKKVLLKPNFVESHPDRPINTHVAVIASAVEACLWLGAAEVVVGEASGHRRDPWFSVLNPSLRAALDKRVRTIDLNHGPAAGVPNKGSRTGLPVFYLAQPAAEADVLVTMPKLKTHHWAGVTLGLKNLFGLLPGIFYGWPKNLLHFRGIENSILDLARTVKIHYSIVDAVTGMEGDGPIMGKAKPVGALVLGAFPLAVDATAARLMGFDPGRVPHLAQARRFLPGLGKGEIVLRGEPAKRFAATFSCPEEFKSMQGGPFF